MSFFFTDGTGAPCMLVSMVEILHSEIPADLDPDASLPGIKPLSDGQWLRRDEAYAAQMAYRRKLIERRRDKVIWASDDASDAIEEVFREAALLFPAMGFAMTTRHLFCPDGAEIDLEADDMLVSLGCAVQEDICILQKSGDEHVLTAAVLCFPASWTLTEKVGRPLTRIHAPVQEYDDRIATRVQRLFDGVQVGKPLWRNNYLFYDSADLHQPMSETDPARQVPPPDDAAYLRAERQCIFRLPQTRAVVFSIHTYVARRTSAQLA